MTEQVVVIVTESGYRVDTFHSPNVEIISFELERWDDQLPDKFELSELRTDIDKIQDTEAKRIMEQWYITNYTDWDAIEKESKQRRAKKKEQEIEDAKILLRNNGVDV